MGLLFLIKYYGQRLEGGKSQSKPLIKSLSQSKSLMINEGKNKPLILLQGTKIQSVQAPRNINVIKNSSNYHGRPYHGSKPTSEGKNPVATLQNSDYRAKNYANYTKMKKLALSNQSKDLVRAKKRIIKAGELGVHSACSVINPGALYRDDEFLLLCRGEPDEQVWFGDFLACQPKPLWCVLDNNLNIKHSFPLNYQTIPANSRPEDWRLFEYQGKLYTNHSIYTMVDKNQWIIRCRPGISEVDLERQRLELCWMLEPPFDPLYEEKNWSFFVHENTLMCIYSFKPYIVLEIDLERGITKKVIEMDHEFSWYDKGCKFVANSTNLIDWDDENYIMFIHDFLEPKYDQRNRAYMQYAALISKSNLLPTSIINRPLVMGGDELGRFSGVHYTSSLVNREDSLYAFYGEGDTHTSSMIFNKNELIKLFAEYQI